MKRLQPIKPNLPASAGSGSVDRRRAIREEIDTAIDLLFTGGSVVAIHLLAWAAADQSRQLVDHLGLQSLQNHCEKGVKRDCVKRFREVLKADYNYFKHARDDPDRSLTGFRPETSIFAIWMALENYKSAFGKMTLPMHYFYVWFLGRNREMLSDEFRAALKLDSHDEFYWKKLSFKDSLKPAQQAYEAYKADPVSHEELRNVPNSGFEFRHVKAK